jgi:alginate O-acetyltransferase complex protein AlgJ
MTVKQYAKAYFVRLVLAAIGWAIVFRPDLAGDMGIEKREPAPLAPLPRSVSAAIDWPSQFDAYVGDHFPGRRSLIHGVAVSAYGMGATISPKVILGEKPWLFLNRSSDVIEEHRGLSTLSRKQAAVWAKDFRSWQRYLAALGSRLILVVVPNKHTVYDEYLPAHLSRVGPTLREVLFSELRRAKIVDVIDLTSLLRKAAEHQQLYRYYDTHWNDVGAALGFNAIMELLNGKGPDTGLRIDWGRETASGDLAHLARLPQLTEEMPVATVVISRDTAKLDLRVFVLGDSFYRYRLDKFFLPTFAEVRYQHHGPLEFPVDKIRQHSPDVIMLIVAERLLPKTLNPPPG